MYTVISLRSRSRVRLRLLHQWLGRDGTCGGRLWVDDENISSQFLIGYLPKTHTHDGEVKRSWKKKKKKSGFIPLIIPTQLQKHPKAMRSTIAAVLLLLATTVTTATDSSVIQCARQKTWNSLASLSNKWWPCWTENSVGGIDAFSVQVFKMQPEQTWFQ